MNKICPCMTTDPYAGAFGLCLLKHGNTYQDIDCSYVGKENWKDCVLYQQQKYEEMIAAINTREMEG